MKFSPIERFGCIVALSPLVPWGMAAWDKSRVDGTEFQGQFYLFRLDVPDQRHGAGLLRVGPWMTAAVLILAIGAPLGFLLLDGISLLIPLSAYLGALPAFFISTREKQDRLMGTGT